MKRTALIAGAFLLSFICATAQERTDTLRVSDQYTTHVIFNTDLIYADLSNSQVMAAKILEQSKNMMALKARGDFSTPLSVSALESNGSMHTYIVLFEKEPRSLVYDMRRKESTPALIPQVKGDSKRREASVPVEGSGAGLYRMADAPLLKDVVESPQSLWHLSRRQYDIEVTCTNIMSYSDITYMVFTVKNSSGVSYECADATFVVESRKASKKSVVYDKNIFPKSRYGTLSCAPGGTARIGYTMDKISLSRDQVLKVYFYEQGGQRELVLTIGHDDINKARTR